MENSLPEIPAKRYFTIGEVSELCGVKPYVLRYWEQEFTQLRPMKRRGNRRYYQHHEVLLIRRIRDLLYEQGFTISGARNQLVELGLNGIGRHAAQLLSRSNEVEEGALDIVIDLPEPAAPAEVEISVLPNEPTPRPLRTGHPLPLLHGTPQPAEVEALRRELFLIRDLLDW